MINQLLKGQVTLVTGGSGGIGKAIAKLFANQGAKVIFFGTNKDKGELVVEEIRRETGREDSAAFYQVDVAQTEEVDKAIKSVLQHFERVDVLVNNAGITCDQLLMKMSEADWDRVIDVNVKSCYNLCHALVRPMMRAKNGKIINMSSVVGLTGNAGQVNYAASKAAIIGFTKALAKELASRSICVNCVAPGFIDTRMTEALTETQKETIVAGIPLGRMGHPEEVANLVLFLASSLADYITGQVITVDGGMVM